MNNNASEQKIVRKKYSPQFEDQALERIAKDGVPQVAKDLGLAESLLYSWKMQQKKGGDSIENQKLQQAEMARLKRENARLAEENAFLKKAAVNSTHYIVGVKEPHALEEKVANLISDTIAPHIIPEIDIIPWRDNYLLMLRVFPSSSRPHYYKKQGPDAGVYIRVGSTNRRADEEMIQELKRIVRNETFDEQPVPDLSSEAIDFRAASEQFEKIRELSEKDLETLEIIVNYQGKKVPSVAGLLGNVPKVFPTFI